MGQKQKSVNFTWGALSHDPEVSSSRRGEKAPLDTRLADLAQKNRARSDAASRPDFRWQSISYRKAPGADPQLNR